MLLPILVATAAGCGPDLRVFDVTITTIRNCHPAGLIPQLCDDKSTFEGRSRKARVAVEIRGQDFIFYDEVGRSLPGAIQRGATFFARTASTTRTSDNCQKDLETNIRFFLRNDFVPEVPRLHDHRKLHFSGNRQDRSSQSLGCGQETSSKFEESLEGDEVGDDGPMTAPWWRP
jgi:hypothetical protein